MDSKAKPTPQMRPNNPVKRSGTKPPAKKDTHPGGNLGKYLHAAKKK